MTTPTDNTAYLREEFINQWIGDRPGVVKELDQLLAAQDTASTIKGAEMLADRIHEHKPLFHTPNKCKLCTVVDGHLAIVKSTLTPKQEKQ